MIMINEILIPTSDCPINGNHVPKQRNPLFLLLPALLQHKEVEYNHHQETLLLQLLIIFLNFHVLQNLKYPKKERRPIMLSPLNLLVRKNQIKESQFFNLDFLL